jgi:hypothetical protein
MAHDNGRKLVSEFERTMIRQRIKADLKRAVARGVKLGRPKIDSATARDVPFGGKLEKHALVLSLTASDPAVIRRLHSTSLSALVTDPATEAWYHPSIA